MTTPSPSPRRAARLLAVLLAGMLALAGCGRIPTDGQVFHYAEGSESTATASPAFHPSGPQDGDGPEEILRGFIAAGTGVADDYAVARSFLTKDVASSWSPEERTWVYQDEVAIDQQGSAASLKARLEVTTRIDDRGIATSYDSVDHQDLAVRLEQVDGQWRISEVPDGTALARSEFEQLFRSFSLYFYDPTYAYAVPDVRWFVNRPTVATSLVRVLLQGPAPYLEDAVVSPVPEGTALQRPSVPVSGDVAQVGLTGNGISQASQLTLERLHSQLRQSLGGIGSISDAAISVDDKKIEVDQLEDYREPAVDPQVSGQQVGVRDRSLVSYAEGQVRAVAGLPDLATAPRHPGMDPSRSVYAYLDETRTRLGVRSKSGRSVDLTLPAGLTKPSVDFRRWVWTASAEGTVHAVDGDEGSDRPRTVDASWLEGQEIFSLEVSRDGSRVLVVTGEGSEARLWTAGIQRAEDGTPTQLSTPLRVRTTVHPTQAQWVSEDTMVVMDSAGDSVEVTTLAGDTQPVNGLSGIRSISGGNGTEDVYAQTDTDTYRLSRNSWARVDGAVQDLSYAG